MRYALTAYVARWVMLIALVLALWLLGVHNLSFGLGALLTEALLLATLIPLWRRGAVGAKDLGLRLVPGARATGLAIMALIAYGWFSVLWTRALHLTPLPRSNFTGISHQSTTTILLAGFAACIGAPVAEEIFFRGFLYRSLRNRFTIVGACLVSSMLFGLDHTQYPLVVRPELVFFGVVTCLLYERTGSLLPGIALHSFVDGSGFERALTGNASVVGSVYLLVAVILLARPPLKGLGRRLTGRPVFRNYPIPEDETAESRELSQQDTPPDARDPADAFGAAGRRWRIGQFAGVLCALLVLFLLVSPFRPSVRLQLHIGSSLPSCAAAGISTSAGREGKCARISGLFSSRVYNVVDRDHTLHMPEYQARLLTSTITHTRVTGPSTNAAYYPEGHGLLVSYEITITNTRDTTLLFGQAASDTTLPFYPSHPQVELLMPPSLASSSRGSNEDIGLGELINGRGAPTPSIGLQQLIPPHGSITGWATFVAPGWSRELLDARPADLNLYRLDHDDHYTGQIRLWK